MDRRPFSFKSEIPAALEEDGILSLFLLCRDSDLVPLVQLLIDVAPEALVGKPQYLSEKDRPGNWPQLLSDGIDALVAKQNASYIRGGGGWRDGLEAVAGRLGIKFSSDSSDAALADAVASLLGRSGPAASAEVRDPRVKGIEGIARAVLLIAALRRTLRMRLRLPGVDTQKNLAAKPTKAGMPDARAARSLLDQLAAGAGATLNDLAGFVPGADFARLPPCNIALAGGTGVGKSTLLNAVFGRDLAATGTGRPVTADAKWYKEPGFPVRLLDTRGLERGDFTRNADELEAKLREARSQSKPGDQIHILWLCIDGSGSRIQEADLQLATMARRLDVPVVVVVTKAWRDSMLPAAARSEFSDPPVRAVVPVIAAQRSFAGGEVVGPSGLDHLIEETLRLLPNAQKAAMAAAQRVLHQPKIEAAREAIDYACKAASMVGGNLIPLSDAALLAPVQIAMVIAITRRMDIMLTEDGWKALIAGTAGALLASLGGRLAVSAVGNLLKAIPGIGTLADGTLNAAVAFGLTKFLGETYLAWLTGRIEQGAVPGIEEIRSFLGRSWIPGISSVR